MNRHRLFVTCLLGLAGACLFLTIGLALPRTPASAEGGWCPPTGDRTYADAFIFSDDGFTQLDDIIEVPDPHLEDCDTLLPGAIWSAQVAWLVGTTAQESAEIGVLKRCTLAGVQRVLYYASAAGMREFRDEFDRPVAARPGQRWRVIVRKTQISSTADLLSFYAEDTEGNKYQGEETPIAHFTATWAQVGGENLYYQNDMGVSGHLETTATTESDDWTFMYYDPTLTIPNLFAPRYVMVKGSGGWGPFGGGAGSYYLQVRSDIHVEATPTPGADPDCE